MFYGKLAHIKSAQRSMDVKTRKKGWRRDSGGGSDHTRKN